MSMSTGLGLLRSTPIIGVYMQKKTFYEYLVMTFGVLLFAVDIHLFKAPNGFAFGGVSGISIVLAKIIPGINVGFIMMVLNIILLVLGFLLLGKSFGKKTVYCTILLSALVWLFEITMPMHGTLTKQTFLELIYAIFLPGIGSAIVFKVGGTTGGTDIIAAIIKKYTHLKISVALLVADFLIAVCSGIIFGVDILLFNIFGVLLKSFAVELVLESLNTYKVFVIISSKPDRIKKFIFEELERGATTHSGNGGFTNKEIEIITTVTSRRQGVRLQRFVKAVDPEAFITISNSSQIIGNGFLGFD